MSPLKIGVIFLLSLSLTEVSSWTIDLPEARKFFFEKADSYGNQNDKSSKEYSDVKTVLEDNIEPDSPHTKHESSSEDDFDNDVYGGKYAEDYQYMSYMEKKVHGIVHAGSEYLEGLRRALDQYARLLQLCEANNFTQPNSPKGPWLPENEKPLPVQPASTNQTSSNNQDESFKNPTSVNSTSVSAELCARATRSSEHVRRLAELALWATRELQDRAYEGKYDKQTQDEEEEEAELLVRLAFFLDRLAFYTGYEPQAKDYLAETTDRSLSSTTTSAPTPSAPIADAPEDMKNVMLSCFNSSESSTERCQYPLEQQEFIRRLFNNTNANSTSSGSETNAPGQNPVENTRQKRAISTEDDVEDIEERGDKENSRDKRGFLMNALFGERQGHRIFEDDHDIFEHEHEHEHDHEHFVDRRRRLIEKLQILKATHKKLVEFMAAVKHRREQIEKVLKDREDGDEFKVKRMAQNSRHKRSAPNPMLDFMKYYVKHKVWINSNQENQGDLDVTNPLPTTKLTVDDYGILIPKDDVSRIKKRSIDHKKYEHLKLPEDPVQDLSNFVKHKKEVNYITDEDEAQKIRQYINKFQNSKSSTAAKKLLKRQKRAAKYYRKFKPSQSENPRQDISYYVKNKEGREYQNNLMQAAQVRENLEFIFQNPNIEVVRRYGSNYNPLIIPLAYGGAQSFYGDL